MLDFVRDPLVHDFKKENRLTVRAEFQSVFKRNARKITSSQFIMLLQPQSTDCNLAKLGMVLPKLKAKNAVVRNQIRRIIRESFRIEKNLLKGWNIIVLLRSKCATVDKKLLRAEVDQLWRQINH